MVMRGKDLFVHFIISYVWRNTICMGMALWTEILTFADKLFFEAQTPLIDEFEVAWICLELRWQFIPLDCMFP